MSPESHPEFGRLICSRRFSIAYWIVAPILIVLGLPFIVFGLFGPFSLYHGSQKSIGQHIILPLVMAVVGSAVAWAGIMCFRRGMTRLHFFEHGVERRRWGKVLSIPYDQATSLTYQLTRQFINGVYAGTSLSLDIRTAGGGRIDYAGNHKERAKGFLPIFSRKFEGTDEMDTVKGVIAGFIADRMQEKLLDGTTLDWCRCATLSAEGLTPRRGKRKGQVVPWSQIDRQTAEKGHFYLFHRGEDRSFVGAPVNGRDFWPTLEVVVRMIQAHLPAADRPAPAAAGSNASE